MNTQIATPTQLRLLQILARNETHQCGQLNHLRHAYVQICGYSITSTELLCEFVGLEALAWISLDHNSKWKISQDGVSAIDIALHFYTRLLGRDSEVLDRDWKCIREEIMKQGQTEVQRLLDSADGLSRSARTSLISYLHRLWQDFNDLKQPGDRYCRSIEQFGVDARQSGQHAKMVRYTQILQSEIDATKQFLRDDGYKQPWNDQPPTS